METFKGLLFNLFFWWSSFDGILLHFWQLVLLFFKYFLNLDMLLCYFNFCNLKCYFFLKYFFRTHKELWNSSAKYIGNKMPRQIQKFSVCLGNASAKKLPRLSAKLCISHRQWLLHTSAFCQGLWFGILTVDTTYSTYIMLFTYNTLKREKHRTIFLPLITLFWFLCVSLL